jgi:hypothetical protein
MRGNVKPVGCGAPCERMNDGVAFQVYYTLGHCPDDQAHLLAPLGLQMTRAAGLRRAGVPAHLRGLRCHTNLSCFR